MAAGAAVPSTIKVYYGKPMLPDVSRVLACLYEKEIDFQLVDMYDGKNMPAQVLKLQGTTMKPPVPALEDNNKLLLESRAICRYLTEKYADKGNIYLMGHDLLDRGTIEQWLKAEEQSFNPPSWSLVLHLAFNPLTTTVQLNEQDQALLAQSTQMLAAVLDVYEHRLRASEYLAGDEFSLADLTHLPNTHYLANSKEWSYLFNSRKNLWRWWEQISSRPSWQKVATMLDEFGALKKASSLQQQPSLAFVGSRPPSTTGHLSETPVSASVESSAPFEESGKVVIKEKSPNAAIVAYRSESIEKSGQQESAAASAAPGKTDAGSSRDTKQPEALTSELNSQSQPQVHSSAKPNPEADAQKSDQPGSTDSPPAPGKTNASAQKSDQPDSADSPPAPGKTDTSAQKSDQPGSADSPPVPGKTDASTQKSDQPGSADSPPAPGKTDAGSSGGPKQVS